MGGVDAARRTGRATGRARPSTVALVLVTGTGALATDTYISALPALQRSLDTSSSTAQLTMTAFIVGSAVGQLGSGPVSDAHGRRRFVLWACVAVLVLSAACAVATSGELLVALRLVQGIAAGTAMAVGRAVVQDVYEGPAAAALFGTLTAVSLIGPVIAPAIGGVLVPLGSWRTVFWFLAVVGVAMWVAALVGLPETLPPERRQPGGLAQLRRRTTDLLTDRHFAAPVLVQCLTVAGFFIYIGGSSFVLQEGLGVSAGVYSAVFTVNALTMVSASVAFRLLVRRCGPVLLRRVGIVVQTVGVGALLTTTLVAGNDAPLVVVWVSLAVMTAGLGVYLPASASIIQHAGRRYAGTASALGGGLPFLAGALTTPMTGLLGSQTLVVMAGAMAVFFALAAVAAVTLRRTTIDPFADPALAVGRASPADR